MRLTGRVTHRGAPQPGARVLWLTPDLGASAAFGESGDDGGFVLDGPADATAAVILARLRGPAMGAVHARVSFPAPGPLTLDLAASAPVWPVTVVARGDVPPQLTLLLGPEQIPGFPPDALEWTYRCDAQTNEPFAVWTLDDGRTELELQEGVWRLLATHAEGARVRGLGTRRSIWRTVGARFGDGAPLPCDPTGVRVEIRGPVTIELEIERAEQA